MSEITTQMLQFLGADSDLLARFFAHTGLAPNQLRAEVGTAAFEAGLIEFFMSDESLLLNFCAHHSIEPTQIQRLYAQHTQFDTSI